MEEVVLAFIFFPHLVSVAPAGGDPEAAACRICRCVLGEAGVRRICRCQGYAICLMETPGLGRKRVSLSTASRFPPRLRGPIVCRIGRRALFLLSSAENSPVLAGLISRVCKHGGPSLSYDCSFTNIQ